MAIRGASWWIVLPEWDCSIDTITDTPRLSLTSTMQHQSRVYSILNTQTNEQIYRWATLSASSVSDVSPQEINERGGRWSASRWRGGKITGNLLCLTGSNAGTSYIIIKKNRKVSVFAFFSVMILWVQSFQSWKKCQKNGCGILPHRPKQYTT